MDRKFNGEVQYVLGKLDAKAIFKQTVVYEQLSLGCYRDDVVGLLRGLMACGGYRGK